MKKIILGSEGMTLEDLVAIARRQAGVRLAEPSRTKILQARELVEEWVREGKVVYGVTTGFGALSDGLFQGRKPGQLQQNLIMSHAAGWALSWKRGGQGCHGPSHQGLCKGELGHSH
jgi:histidine ammonia-lyase